MRAIRGAITNKSNTRKDILNNSTKLIKTIIESNNIENSEMVSMIFTATVDLNREYPAVAARKLGYTNIPLMCYQELSVKNSLKKCIRCMIYINRNCNLDEIKHIYLKKAKQLRPDLIEE